MKIGDNKPLRGPREATPVRPAPRAAADPGAGAGAAKPTHDVASVMDIPESEFTPKVRAAIMALMAEVEKLRREQHMSLQRIKHLEQLADQDTLTPVANRRAFVRELSRSISFTERYEARGAVIYFDVNGLKQVNDNFGHAAGDAVLEHVARIMVANVRDSDFVGRLGGDEFGVILAQADQASAHEKAEQLRTMIAAAPLDWRGTQIPIAVSYGTYSFSGGDPVQALDAADRDMYVRKKGAPGVS